jgi:hypothetical protein
MKKCYCGHARFNHKNHIDEEGRRDTGCATWGCKCDTFYPAAE